MHIYLLLYIFQLLTRALLFQFEEFLLTCNDCLVVVNSINFTCLENYFLFNCERQLYPKEYFSYYFVFLQYFILLFSSSVVHWLFSCFLFNLDVFVLSAVFFFLVVDFKPQSTEVRKDASHAIFFD